MLVRWMGVAVVPAMAAGHLPQDGLQLWLSADKKVIVDGDYVAQWGDQSGHTTSAIQPDGRRQPRYLADAINGHPVVSFDRGISMASKLPVSGLSSLTILLVSTSVDPNAAALEPVDAALSWGPSANGGGMFLAPFQKSVRFRFGTGDSDDASAEWSSEATRGKFTVTTLMKAGRQELLFMNGSPALAQQGRLPVIVNTSETLHLGGTFQGEIAEIVVYTKILSNAERSQAEQYLINKYGLSPDANREFPDVSAGPGAQNPSSSVMALRGFLGPRMAGGNASTQWSKISGPGTVTFEKAGAPSTSATFSAPGAYVLRLTAINGEARASDEVAVLVGDGPMAQISSPGPGTNGLADHWLANVAQKGFVSGYQAGTLVRDGSSAYWAGMKLTTGPAPVTVSALGRLMLEGNMQTHTLKLVEAETKTDVPGASVWISMAGEVVGEFVYAPLLNPVVLQAHTAYYLVSSEAEGGDHFYGHNQSVVSTAAAKVDSAIQGSDTWREFGGQDNTYGAVSFKYLASDATGNSASLVSDPSTLPESSQKSSSIGLHRLPPQARVRF